jgi:hypothetical protein
MVRGLPYIPNKILDEYIEYLHQTVKHRDKLDNREFWMYIALNYDRGLGGTRNNWLDCLTCEDNRHTDVWNYIRKTPKTVARTTN